MQPTKIPRPVFLAVAVVAFAISAMTLFRIYREKRLAEGFATTVGTIRGHVQNSHGQVAYFYEVAGRHYEGVATRDVASVAGEETTVFYSPVNPSNSALRYPSGPDSFDFLLLSGSVTILAAMVIKARRAPTRSEWCEKN